MTGMLLAADGGDELADLRFLEDEGSAGFEGGLVHQAGVNFDHARAGYDFSDVSGANTAPGENGDAPVAGFYESA